ncbi:uncharacterized protein LOC119370309 [Jatropha curcas]|uniref:uncharacterized protein LOC119370309 n=1 Tax=Jatropha curcas TaxID=180498 RepID=UPI001894718F|nr:uncharacterized protein LOC119370309 [Jatropha curcas]
MIFENVSLKSKLSYGQLGKIVLVILGSGKLCNELYEKIMGGLEWNYSWNNLIKDLCRNDASNNIVRGELSLKWVLQEALVDAYSANWRKEYDYISPGCFLYLVERQLILLSCFHGYFLTTKSSFVEWNDHFLLGRNDITEQLPREFGNVLKKRRKRNSLTLDVNVLAEAFKKIDNNLVIVSLGKSYPRKFGPDAIFVYVKANQSIEDIFRDLFPKRNENSVDNKGSVDVGTTSSSSVINFAADRNSNIKAKSDVTHSLTLGHSWELFESLKSEKHLINDPKVKEDIEKTIQLLSGHGILSNPDGENESLFREAVNMLDELKQLNAALDVSEVKLRNDNSAIGELLNKLQSRRPSMEPFLIQMFSKKDEKLKGEASKIRIALDGEGDG